MPLTETKIKAEIKKFDLNKSKYIFDGDGLYLEIRKSSKAFWQFKYTFEGKARKKSLGQYPVITLANARSMRLNAKTKIANGEDPFLVIIEEDITKPKEYTFKQGSQIYSDEYMITQSQGHYSRTFKGWERDLYVQKSKNGKKDNFAALRIGDKSMNEIDISDIRAIIKMMIDRGAPQSASKVFSSIKLVYDYMIQAHNKKSGYRRITSNPCDSIKLKFLIHREKKHYPIITEENELRALLINMDKLSSAPSIRLGLKMIAHTFVRPSNIRTARWEHINLTTKEWIIPKELMKGTKKKRKSLVVPLSTQVIKILKEAKAEYGDVGLIFPSPRSRTQPLSDAALLSVIRRMGYTTKELVAHSFRGMFSTIAHEKNKFYHDVIESQLAHTVGSDVSRAYNRAQYKDTRVQMMQWYSDYLEGIKNDLRSAS